MSGHISRLLITMPPRHGKSLFASQYFPATYLGTFPDRRVILASYEADFAASWGRNVRDLIQVYGPEYFGVSVRSDSTAADRWDIANHEGGMVTAGVGGGITGRGANCFSAGTMIETERGDIDICTLVRLQSRPKVRTFNHRTGRLEWRRIVAVRSQPTEETHVIRTRNGRIVRCTGNHPFYVPGVGYVAASLLAPGTPLCGLQSVSDVRFSEEREKGSDLSSVLLDDVVAWIGRRREGSESVYDLQVEGTSNFFANGLLVHNCLIIDDPVKNDEQAASATYREKTWSWYLSTAFTRLEPGGAIILVQTRWSEDDLAGRILTRSETAREPWHVVNLPAFALADDPIGRAEGDPLWPERYDREALEDIRHELGEYFFSALYQQSPSPAGGGMLKSVWFERVDAAPANTPSVRYWDKAGTQGSGDYTAGVLISRRSDGIFFVVDIVRGQWSAGEREARIKQTAERDGTGVAIWIEQEPGSGGKESAQNTIMNLAGWNVHAETVSGDKPTRARPLAAQAEAGNLRMVRDTPNRPWNEVFRSELDVFPNGRHDDMVDASSGAFNKLVLMDRPGAPVVAGRRPGLNAGQVTWIGGRR